MPNVSRKKPKERKERNIMRESGPQKRILISDDRQGTRAGRLAGQMLSPAPQGDQASRPEVEEWKWAVPVWSRRLICTSETYKNVVKMTTRGPRPGDPSGLFNSSLDGNTRRASTSRGREDSRVALKALIRAA
jgi:hypothetical protein